MREFLRFTVSQAEDLVRTVGYVPLPAADYAEIRAQAERLLES